MLKTKKLKYWQRAIIGLSCMLLIVFMLFYFTSVYVSNDYANFYNDPMIIDGVLDCSTLSAENPAVLAYGEVEFFYNKWIKTDNYTGEPDGLIPIRSMWTGKEFNGVKLPKTGFASYRVLLKNVREGFVMDARIHRCEMPFRVYIGDTIVSEFGVLSKEVDKGYINGSYTRTGTYAPTTTEDVYLVVEVSANSIGGLTDVIGMKTNCNIGKSSTAYWIFDAPKIMLGILIALCSFVFIICLSEFKQKRDMSPSMFLFSMILYYFSTKDGFPIFSGVFMPAPPVEFALNIVCAFLLNASYLRYTCKGGFAQFRRFETIPLYATFGISCLTQLLLLGTLWQLVPITLNMICLIYIAYKQFSIPKKLNVYAIIQGCFCAIVMLLQLFMAVDYLGITVQGMETYPAIGIILMAVILNTTYLIIMRKNANMAISALKLEKENNEIKQNALKAQIKPHFIFNSLTCIQRLYRDSFENGDIALTQFSDHLRLNIDSNTKDTTTFEKETLNILNYFDLENMRHNYSLNLIFNVTYTDFMLPILSLQPIVENALKYSGIDKKADGAIEIYTEDLGDKILVKISDNGIGFDINKIGSNSHGLKNVSERLKLLINATTTIESTIGIGTTVSILIPKENVQ